MRSVLVAVAAAATLAGSCLTSGRADAQQRASSLVEKATIIAVDEEILAKRRDLRGAPACRDACIAHRQCTMWDYDEEGEPPRRGPRECWLYRGEPMFNALGASGTAAGQIAGTEPGMFPLPRAGLFVGFRIDGHLPRWASYRFHSHDGDIALGERRAWEGDYRDGPQQRAEQIRFTGGLTLVPTCHLSVSPSRLRALARELGYLQTCEYVSANSRSVSRATVDRSVTGRRTLTLPAGRFEGLEVTSRTRTESRTSLTRRMGATLEEVQETVVTRLWVESLGFYVEQTQETRLPVRRASEAWVQEEGPRPPSTGTDRTRLYAVEVRQGG